MPVSSPVEVLDHLFVLAFAVVYPTLGYLSFRRLLRDVAAGHAPERLRLYLQTIVGQWLLLGLGVVIWRCLDRDIVMLGFSVTGNLNSVVATAVAVAAVAFLIGQGRAVRAAPADELPDIVTAFGDMRHLLPRTRRELRRFYIVGIAAGICEEILWRGVLLWYLQQLMPMWAAVLLATLWFGIAHAYQGAAFVPRVTLVGAVLMMLYLLTGSLLLPILVHIAIDVLQGRLAYDVLTRHALVDPPLPER